MIKDVKNYDDLIGKNLAYYIPYNSNSLIMNVGTAYDAKIVSVVRYLYDKNEMKIKLIANLTNDDKNEEHLIQTIKDQLIDIDDPNLYESMDKLWDEWSQKENDERNRRKSEMLRQTVISYMNKIGEQLHDVEIERISGFENEEFERMIKDLKIVSNKLDKIKMYGSKVIDAFLMGFDKIKE